MAEASIQIAVIIPAEADAKLRCLAAEDQRPLAGYCRKVLLAHLAQIERDKGEVQPAEVT